MWDNLFAYYSIDPKPGGTLTVVDPARRVNRHVSGVSYGQHLVNDKDFGKRDMNFLKVTGQGDFDNVHIAPQMIPPPLVIRLAEKDKKSEDLRKSLKATAMAPFCVHDCLHMHWRWSSDVGDIHNRGWKDGVPYSGMGTALVPENQMVRVQILSQYSIRYIAEVTGDRRFGDGPVPAGKWQVVLHHGAAYALSIGADGVLAKEKMKIMINGPAQSDIHDVGDKEYAGVKNWVRGDEVFLEGEAGSWAMFYWHLRYACNGDDVRERLLCDVNRAAAS
jgi:hypothetical protein